MSHSWRVCHKATPWPVKRASPWRRWPDHFRSIRALCLEAGFDPELRHEVRHWLSVLSLVSCGQGVAIVPACLQRVGIPGRAFVALRHATAVSELQAMWRPVPDHPLVETLLTLLQHHVPGHACYVC